MENESLFLVEITMNLLIRNGVNLDGNDLRRLLPFMTTLRDYTEELRKGKISWDNYSGVITRDYGFLQSGSPHYCSDDHLQNFLNTIKKNIEN